MSSLTEADYKDVSITGYLQLAAAVLFLYDSAITTGDEMRLLWGRKLTSATVLFHLNKYLLMLYYAFFFVSLLQLSDERCADVVRISFVVVLLPYILVWGPFTALRTYALCRNWFLPSIIVFLYGVPVAVNLTRFWRGISGANIPPLGCTNEEVSTVREEKIVASISRGSLIIANCIAIGATWATMRRGFPHFEHSGRRTLAGVLLWDGLAYFLVLAILDSLHLTLTMISIMDFNDNSSSVTVFTTPLTAILVSRFILDLQAADRRLVAGTVDSSQELSGPNGSSLVFEKIIGSLGASIAMDGHITEDSYEGDSSMGGGYPY